MKNNNISLLRGIAISFIVMHHTLCAFGCWPPNHRFDTYIPALLYEDVSFALKDIGLELFTFISGYLFYFQKKYCFNVIICKKTYRIVVPCVLCALMYRIMFPSYMFSTFPAPINGTHLWYLPMLFLCTMITSLSFFTKRSVLWIIIVYLILVLINKFYYLRTILVTIMYLPIFYTGFLSNKLAIETKVKKNMNKFATIFLCLITFFTSFLIKDCVASPIMQCIRPLLLYMIVYLIWKNRLVNILYLQVVNSSLAIYLIHQFVINGILSISELNGIPYYFVIPLVFIPSLFIPIFIDKLSTKLYIWKKYTL